MLNIHYLVNSVGLIAISSFKVIADGADKFHFTLASVFEENNLRITGINETITAIVIIGLMW